MRQSSFREICEKRIVPLAPEQGNQTQDQAHHHAHGRGDGRADYPQPRERANAVDQKIVEADVYQVGDNVYIHGQLGVANPPLGGANAHGKGVGRQRRTHDEEIFRSVLQGAPLLRSRKAHQRIRKGQRQRHQHKGKPQDDEDHVPHHLVGLFLASFALSPGHHRGNAHVQREEKAQHQHSGLIHQTYRRHRVGAQAADHDGVHHVDQADQHHFTHGRNGQPDKFPVHGAAGG